MTNQSQTRIDPLELEASIGGPQAINQCVVRLTTTAWQDRRGVHLKKSLVFMRRKCIGFNILEEDAKMIGVAEVIGHIDNLDSCVDGVYEIGVCHKHHDRESGELADYDYRLWPHQEER
jgi:hypothetical protein